MKPKPGVNLLAALRHLAPGDLAKHLARALKPGQKLGAAPAEPVGPPDADTLNWMQSVERHTDALLTTIKSQRRVSAALQLKIALFLSVFLNELRAQTGLPLIRRQPEAQAPAGSQKESLADLLPPGAPPIGGVTYPPHVPQEPLLLEGAAPEPCDHEAEDGRCIHCGAPEPCADCGGAGCSTCNGVSVP